MNDNGDKLIEKIRNDKEDEIFTLRPREEWLRLFREHDLFVCAINTLEDLTTLRTSAELPSCSEFDNSASVTHAPATIHHDQATDC